MTVVPDLIASRGRIPARLVRDPDTRGRISDTSADFRGLAVGTQAAGDAGMRHRHAVILVALVACGADDGTPGSAADARAVSVTGVYSCSIETIDGYVWCGGPVYTTNLSGQGLSLSVTQQNRDLEAGIWGKVLRGSVDPDGRVTLQYRDTQCYACDSNRPFLIDVAGVASERQISNISIRMHQSSIDECVKTYRGTCAAN